MSIPNARAPIFSYVAVSGEGDRSFVELFNKSGARIDLSDWALVSLKSGMALFQFSVGFGIDPEELLLIELGETGDRDDGRSDGALLNSKEDTAMLVDASGGVIDSVRYGGQVLGSSLIRGADGFWILGVPSPGFMNQPRDLAAPSQFVINEWQSNPLPGQDDWFEIYNPDPSNPGALRGLTFSDGESLVTLRSLVFVPPNGFVRLWADNGRGPDHLPFRLASGGGKIEILSGDSSIVDSIVYEAQQEGETMGRLPDGGVDLVRFTDGGSPGRSNVQPVTGDLVLSEILWVNEASVKGPHGGFSSFIEVANVGINEQDLAGKSLRVESVGLDWWVFPAGSTLKAGERRVIWLDLELPANDDGNFYFDVVDLPSIAGGHVELVEADGRVLNSIRFGYQVVDVSLGRFGSEWALCQSPSPGEEESMLLELGAPHSLRVNEWLVAPVNGPDWIELYNSGDQVVGLGGLVLTDRPGLLGEMDPEIGPYHYIGPMSWTTIGSSRSFPAGAQSTLGFSLAREGEFIRLYDSIGQVIDRVDFSRQAPGRSEGRIPDGSQDIATALIPSPGASNVGQETLDSDQDGIPDEWELVHGLDPIDSLDALLDPDQDGVINLDEYFDDTDPHDEIEMIIGAISIGPEGVLLQFNVRENLRYRLEFKTELLNGGWELETEFSTEEGQTLVEFLDESISRDVARYYRLIRL
ncbi:lamin tail domain-containing protein [Verrucomicrobia bacterium]|nr:lamin tail domain-containing protein [Verrucomicrobiota bacterium]